MGYILKHLLFYRSDPVVLAACKCFDVPDTVKMTVNWNLNNVCRLNYQ